MSGWPTSRSSSAMISSTSSPSSAAGRPSRKKSPRSSKDDVGVGIEVPGGREGVLGGVLIALEEAFALPLSLRGCAAVSSSSSDLGPPSSTSSGSPASPRLSYARSVIVHESNDFDVPLYRFRPAAPAWPAWLRRAPPLGPPLQCQSSGPHHRRVRGGPSAAALPRRAARCSIRPAI